MTSNETHLLVLEATLLECRNLVLNLERVQQVLQSTEPPRRDSVGPDVAHLNLRAYKATLQAKEAMAMLEGLLERTRRG